MNIMINVMQYLALFNYLNIHNMARQASIRSIYCKRILLKKSSLSYSSICLVLTFATACTNAMGQNTQLNSPSISATEYQKYVSASQPKKTQLNTDLQQDQEDTIQTNMVSLIQRPKDEKRPKDQFTLQLFNRPLTIGGGIDTELRSREDLSLGRKDDSDSRFGLGFKVELLYHVTPNTLFSVEIDSSYQKDLYSEDGDKQSSTEAELDEFWFHVTESESQHLSVQIGRQYFGDQREWWWDQKLDGVRVQYAHKPFDIQFGVGTNPTVISTEKKRLDPEDEDIIWLLASADWEWKRKNNLSVFFVSRFDRSSTPNIGDILPEHREDEEDATINWFGLRSQGRLKTEDLGKIYYWFDSGVVHGKETLIDFDDIGDDQSKVANLSERTINGWGVDIGVTWEMDLPYTPRLTLGYAKGSGDNNPNDNIDNAYRQTGLHSNNDKFRGVNSFRYYGELLRPELSNLTIATIALGFPFLNDSSIEFIYHRYTQVYAADSLRNSRISTDPEGKYRDIGEEFNIALGIEEWKQFELELIATQFRAGKAYGVFSGRTASSITLQAKYNF